MHALFWPPIRLGKSRGKSIHPLLRLSVVKFIVVIVVVAAAAAIGHRHHRCRCRLLEHASVGWCGRDFRQKCCGAG